VKYNPSAVPIAHWPASRTGTGQCKLAPHRRSAAVANKGPIIHGSGVPILVQTTAATRPISMADRKGNINLSLDLRLSLYLKLSLSA
jgi:hypothetical protein